jgi:predicted  nucleic acid-binding Zn-ribbon protein
MMTQDEKDAQVGRIVRESKEAEQHLGQLLVKAERIAANLEGLARSIRDRVQNAKRLGSIEESEHGGLREIEERDQPLNIQSKSLHTHDELRELDREISEASERAATLRRQRDELGLGS